MDKYNVLDTINTNHFYYASVSDAEGDIIGVMEIFPTIDDADLWIKEATDEFIKIGGKWRNLVIEFLEYNLTDEDFKNIDGNVETFFDNLYELPYKEIIVLKRGN